MKKIVAIVLVIIMLLTFTACDGTRKIEYAYITLPNGNVVEVDVDHYVMISSRVIITAKDGHKYITSVVNCLLTTDRLDEVGE